MRIVRSAFLDRISRRAGVFWDAPPPLKRRFFVLESLYEKYLQEGLHHVSGIRSYQSPV